MQELASAEVGRELITHHLICVEKAKLYTLMMVAMHWESRKTSAASCYSGADTAVILKDDKQRIGWLGNTQLELTRYHCEQKLGQGEYLRCSFFPLYFHRYPSLFLNRTFEDIATSFSK